MQFIYIRIPSISLGVYENVWFLDTLEPGASKNVAKTRWTAAPRFQKQTNDWLSNHNYQVSGEYYYFERTGGDLNPENHIYHYLIPIEKV